MTSSCPLTRGAISEAASRLHEQLYGIDIRLGHEGKGKIDGEQVAEAGARVADAEPIVSAGQQLVVEVEGVGRRERRLEFRSQAEAAEPGRIQRLAFAVAGRHEHFERLSDLDAQAAGERIGA